jgi:hypothetical protein
MWKSNRKSRKMLSQNPIVQVPSSLLSVPSQSKSPSQSIYNSTLQSIPSLQLLNRQTCLVYHPCLNPIQSLINADSHLPDNANQQKTAKDVAGRENKGMGMADKLAGAVKDPINQTLGGNNQKSKGEDAEQNDTKGESLPGSSIPGKNY